MATNGTAACEHLCTSSVFPDVKFFGESLLKNELALLAALQRDISERLRPVCSDMSDETFQEIVRDIVAVKLKYGVESELSAALQLELEQFSSRMRNGSGGLGDDSSTERTI